MNRIQRNAPSGLALVIAIVACTALGGAAGAAGMVTSKQIKNGSVTGVDLTAHTLSNKDFDPKARGAAGAPGAAGGDGDAGYELVSTSKVIAAGTYSSVSAVCPGDKVVTGATGDWVGTYKGVGLSSYEHGASAYGYNTTGGADTLRLRVYCINPASGQG